MIRDEAEVFASGLDMARLGFELFARQVEVELLIAEAQSMSVTGSISG